MAFAALIPLAMSAISAGAQAAGNKQAQAGNAKAARLQQIQNAIAQQKRIEALGEQKQVLGDARDQQVGVLNDAQGNQLDMITRAALEAAGYLVNGTENAANAYKSGAAESDAELRRMMVANAPGMARMRQAIADEGTITPYQQQQIDEADRQAKNAIRSSSLAGSGRSAAALLKKVVGDTRMNALESNRQTALGAASTLAGNENAARGRVATNAAQLGSQLGQLYDSQGRMLAGNINDAGSRLAGIFGNTGSQVSNAIGSTASQISSNIGKAYGDNAATDEKTGQVQANAAAANGQLSSQTTGAIGGAIADALRGSKYSMPSVTGGGLGTTPGSGGLY